MGHPPPGAILKRRNATMPRIPPGRSGASPASGP